MENEGSRHSNPSKCWVGKQGESFKRFDWDGQLKSCSNALKLVLYFKS